MKKIEDICIVVQARLGSQRTPNKMLKPFAGTTLFDIALKKAEQCIVPNKNIFASVHEEELKRVASKYDVQIFNRSEKSANSEGTPITEIFEWWDKLPGKYVLFINACCPMLTVNSIDEFIYEYATCTTNGAFGVVEKKNYFWTNGIQATIRHDNMYTSWIDVEGMMSPSEGVMNTKTAPIVLEAAHVLYAGLLEDIGRGVWMGDLATGKGITFISIPEIECLDIDYPWQFDAWEKVYENLYKH